MTHDSSISAEHMLHDAYLATDHGTPALTLVPPSYPALEAEVYALLEEITDRETLIPPASVQVGLEIACATEEWR